MKLYNELSTWWPLLSPYTEYEEESALYLKIIQKYHQRIYTALEFGSGGGSNAFYMKDYFKMTLTDLSPQMITISTDLNPDCEHKQGDMRTIDLGRTFDLVFIHDAITYLTSEEDLLAVFNNAKKHLNDTGILFLVPDHFTETFQTNTDHGGIDSAGRSLRYLEWVYNHPLNDNLVVTDYVYLLKNENGNVTREFDHETSGLFSKDTWSQLLERAGFKAIFEPIEHSELKQGSYVGIAAVQI